MPEMPFGPRVTPFQLLTDDPEDLAEAERHDGQVVAPQPQGRCADDHPEERGDGGPEQDHEQERQVDVDGGQPAPPKQAAT